MVHLVTWQLNFKYFFNWVGKIECHISRIKEVIWNSLIVFWITYNTDDISMSYHGPTKCGDIFIDNNIDVVGWHWGLYMLR
jgi:hypothetical protein